MNTDEDQLRALLHRFVPHPPYEIKLTDATGVARGEQVPRPPGNRRSSWGPLLSAAAVVAIASAGAAIYAIRNGDNSPTAPLTSASDRRSPTERPRTTAAASTSPAPSSERSSQPVVGACAPAGMTASLGRRGSVASAPFVVVVIRNLASATCTMDGYPKLRVYSADILVRPSVQHGTYEVSDPGPRQFRLPPGAAASFAFGTSTGYSGGPVTITKLIIGLPGAARGSLTLRIPGGIGATSLPNGRVPVGITAITQGTGS